MLTGTISKYFPREEYGLIIDDNGQEHFFYKKDLERECGKEIKKGVKVQFDPSNWNYYHAVHLCAEHQDLEKKIRTKSL